MGEIKAAIDHAKRNPIPPIILTRRLIRRKSSVATFISEMRQVASPKVCGGFNDLADACQKAWEEENLQIAAAKLAGEDPKTLHTPVHKYKSRLWHLVIDFARRVADDKKNQTSFVGPYDVIVYCEAHDPDEDAEKVAKRLEAIAKMIDDVYKDFADPDLRMAADYMRAIEPDALRPFKVKKTTATSQAYEGPLAPLPPKPTPTTVEAPPPVSEAPGAAAPTLPPTLPPTLEPATGVFDPLDGIDDLLGDKPAFMLAAD